MHDVAALAGVSQATVSLVLNDVSGSRFSRKTKDKVEAAVEQLGYRTNAHAKVLRDGVAGMIGFIGDYVATSPFAGTIIEGAQERAWEDGLLLLTVNTGGDKELEAASLDTMLSYKVAGVVYGAMYHRRLDVPEALAGVPSVVLNSQDRAGRLPSVAPDEVRGGYTATRRLLEAGHSRVGLINIESLESGLPAAVGRHEGYGRALEEAGLAPDPSLVRFGKGGEEDGYKYAMELLTSSKPPTAIFCANDRGAWGAYQAVAELGLSIPRDVSIVGFDNQATLAPYLRPGLTTLELPFVAMGRRAVEIILQGAGPDGRVELMDCPLVERNSVTHPKEMP
ncbi:LacI family DNA-binding transcriptional regulator [Arthrobacter sp. MI7-26]|uniref:LacI family DNA-binding transcriptional regulator n=1 Tax=Arthrobacter sp. MI7-26 TaxID=2993653 RepID=UPI00224961D6|nr:LacI family DNA-binding transcriptional regulator [Arthrobacter sp. MI7-26]MCX2748767.1 LacI family DNA-binding transcriptional regulator [Arthrobacter sp. MI7-26]